MNGRRAGWIFGGLGAFCWVPILSFVLLARGFVLGGVLSLTFAVLGIAYLLFVTPWRFSATPFWKIYLGLLVIFVACAISVILFWREGDYGGVKSLWMLVYLTPMLGPFFTMKNIKW